MIENVERLGAELQFAPLAEREVLEQAQIPVLESRADQDVAAAVAPYAGRHQRGVDEHLRVEPAGGSAVAAAQVGIAGDAGTRRARADAADIDGNGHARGRAALERGHAGHLPSAEDQARGHVRAAGEKRQRVDVVEVQQVRAMNAGQPDIELRMVAVLRRAAAHGIHGFGERVVDAKRQARAIRREALTCRLL